MQTAIEGSPDRPWAKGVDVEQQRQARVKFYDGNLLLKDGAFGQAAIRYREALTFWDHPGIHYNLALALINLEQLVEVRRELMAALRYGAAPLDQDKFDHAQSYLKLIEQQLTHLDVVCNVPGAVVRLDGQPLFTGPGRFSDYVKPGKHRISAEKSGFEASNYDRTLLPGQKASLSLRLFSSEERTRYERRWPFWVPASLTVAGVATTAAGALFMLQARSDFGKYDSRVDTSADCRDAGCFPSNEMNRLKDRAERYQTIGGVTLGLGGSMLVSGAVLMWLNGARAYRIDPIEGGARVSLAPVLTPNLAGISGSGRF